MRVMWSRRAVTVMGVLLVVVGLIGAWQTTGEARGAWRDFTHRDAIVPGADGVVEAGGLRISVDEVGVLESVPATGGDVTPLQGHRFWHVGLHMDIADSEFISCRIYIEDTEGRHYEQGRHVPGGVDGYDTPRCAESETADAVEVDPVQAFIVVIPADADPRYVRVVGERGFDRQHLELPANPARASSTRIF